MNAELFLIASYFKEWPEDIDYLEVLNKVIRGRGAAMNCDRTRLTDVEFPDGYVSRQYHKKEWQDAVELIKSIVSADWRGEGLPPVGAHAVVHDDGSLVYGQGESGEVLAHVDGCAVIRMSYGLGCFLPRCLRTPDQIAAEERTKTIDDMVKALGMDEPGTAEYIRCGLIYDAGYRKQVQP